MDVPKTLDCTFIEEKDLVSRYVGQKLSPEEAEAFEEHYFGCDKCWAEVQAATEVKAALQRSAVTIETPAAPSGRVIRGPWRTAGILAAAAALAIVLAGILLRPRGNTFERLVRSSEQLQNRPIEARLSAPFSYRPVGKAFRGEQKDALPLDLRRAALDAQSEAQAAPDSVERLRASAAGHLLLGEEDAAISELERAHKVDPKNPLLENDLAAAYYSRALSRYGIRDFVHSLADMDKALELADEALKANPSFAAALFNRALILEARHFRDEAAHAWRKYLDVDATSEWANEARAHLAILESPTQSFLWKGELEQLRRAISSGEDKVVLEVVTRFPQESRVYVEDEILPAWGKAVNADSGKRARLIRLAKGIADALARAHAESFLEDALTEIGADRAQQEESRRVSDLSAAYATYGEGRELYRAHRIDEAQRVLERSLSEFVGQRSVFAAQVRVILAACSFYESDFASADRLLNEVESDPRMSAERYASVLGQLHWVRGLSYLSRGHPAESLEAYRRCLAAFEAIGEVENVAAAHTLLAENFQYLGDVDSAAYHLDRALAVLGPLGPTPRLHTTLREIAISTLENGQVHLSRIAHEHLASISLKEKNPLFECDALLLLSIVQQKTQDPELALQTARAARRSCAGIHEDGVRQRAEADLDVAEALAWRAADPERSEIILSTAVDYFTRVGNHSRLAQVYLERGLLRRSRGRIHEAETDLIAGIAELESQRGRITDQPHRLSYFDNGRDLFDELIAILADRADAERSLEYAERGRARALLDAVGRPSGSVAPEAPIRNASSSAEIASSVSPAEALVEYLVLGDRTVAWVVVGGGTRLRSLEIPEAQLSTLVNELRRGLSETDDPKAWRAASAALYDCLIRPLKSDLTAVETLIVVPDKFLNALPFSALWDQQTERFLVQDYTLECSPSGSMFVASLKRRRQPAHGFRSAVVVQNPSFDRRRFPGLRALRFAAVDAQAIASNYSVNEIEQGDGATKARFLETAARFDVVHFAGHAVINDREPSLSMLLLAPDSVTGDSGLLYASDIARSRFDQTSLIVLAACDTARGYVRRAEGPMTLARAFLEAGAPSVLATLWQVDDESTARFFAVFHGRLAAGANPAEALRSTQLSMLDSPPLERRGPGGWAAFVVVGAS